MHLEYKTQVLMHARVVHETEYSDWDIANKYR